MYQKMEVCKGRFDQQCLFTHDDLMMMIYFVLPLHLKLLKIILFKSRTKKSKINSHLQRGINTLSEYGLKLH